MEDARRPHSMSTDNTASSDDLNSAPEQHLLSEVHTGMHVVDTEGKDIGTVTDMRLSEPAAAGIDPAEAPGALSPLDDLLAGWFGGRHDIPETLRHRMLHEGFLKIGQTGLFGNATFALASEIGSVAGDTVRLTVPERDLIHV